MKQLLKTPITYYGGKMVCHILPLIPEHHTYIEPFFGGGAIFFAKQPSAAEVVNDINHRLVTFYKVLKYDFDEIHRLLDETFHSRASTRIPSRFTRARKTRSPTPFSVPYM